MDIAIKKAKEAGIGWVTAKGKTTGTFICKVKKSNRNLNIHVNFLTI